MLSLQCVGMQEVSFIDLLNMDSSTTLFAVTAATLTCHCSQQRGHSLWMGTVGYADNASEKDQSLVTPSSLVHT